MSILSNKSIMLKLNYFLRVKTQNNKLTKINFLMLHLLWVYLLAVKKKINFTKNTKTLKTLLLSPFHYKVAKKNILKKNHNLNIMFCFRSLIERKLLYFRYLTYLNICFMFITICKITVIRQ